MYIFFPTSTNGLPTATDGKLAIPLHEIKRCKNRRGEK